MYLVVLDPVAFVTNDHLEVQMLASTKLAGGILGLTEQLIVGNHHRNVLQASTFKLQGRANNNRILLDDSQPLMSLAHPVVFERHWGND